MKLIDQIAQLSGSLKTSEQAPRKKVVKGVPMKMFGRQNQIIDILWEERRPLNTQEIGDLAGCSSQLAAMALRKLDRRGRVTVVKKVKLGVTKNLCNVWYLTQKEIENGQKPST